jgi:hypothetical protein
MDNMTWADPPERKNPVGKHKAIASALKANPGRWALIVPNASGSSVVTSIRSARYVAYAPAGSFDARGVTNDSGKVDVYARFVGEAE